MYERWELEPDITIYMSCKIFICSGIVTDIYKLEYITCSDQVY